MNDLQNFIIKKGLEKASVETIKQAIIQDPYLSNDVKEQIPLESNMLLKQNIR